MTGVRFSVIVPTVGRPTLAGTLASLAGQLEPGDEAVVVGDGPQPGAERLCGLLPGVRYLERSVSGSRFGNAQRDCAMATASGSHLLFIDDDDCYEPSALTVIRAAVARAPEQPHVFRARWGAGHPACGVELWRLPELRVGNVGTPMVCLPNRRYLASWMEHNGDGVVSDFGFLADAIGEAGRPVWHEEPIVVVRP